MTPVYSHRKQNKRSGYAGDPGTIPNLSGNGQTMEVEVLDRSNADAEQWNSAYQQLFDRN
jgi:hypothetical protein